VIEYRIQQPGRFVDEGALELIGPSVNAAHEALINKTGQGNEFLGWRDIVTEPDDALLADIDRTASEIRSRADVLVCVGIGGSYLGARAVIDALSNRFRPHGPEIIFAGHHMGPSYITELLEHLEGKSVYVNVISKSGTTLEPALAFRFIFEWMRDRFDDLGDRIIVTTDRERGALNQLQQQLGLRKYVIPDDVGGRFSVLTPVGLLPIAVSGTDIRSLLYGAVLQARTLSNRVDNPALKYAACRFLLHEAGFRVEALSTFDPRLFGIGGWWKQLFGESEGKEGKGLLPVTLEYTTDLHALGQYVQEGRKMIAETFLVTQDLTGPIVPHDEMNLDGLNYLSGRSIAEINRVAYEGTLAAHSDGGVPVATIEIPDVTPESVGALLYFFEHAVAVGGYLLDLNPFDQPGVEAYKNEMFRRLGKPRG
jgi:glucose-6-phosphate isomerase